MFLQLKDLASQKLITVPEEGMTFGREGGDAQVQVADMGVSKRHAEVFCEAGAWFIKDLGSSNGTMLANERVADATEILPGDVFHLSKRKFEVLKVLEHDGESNDSAEHQAERKAAAKPSAGRPGLEPTLASSERNGVVNEEVMAEMSASQALAAVPKAMAYYLVNVPLLALKPFGTVRKAIEEQPSPPRGREELIAWAIPGVVLWVTMAFFAGLIGQLIVGSLSIGSLSSGLAVGAIAGTVLSVVSGLIWHPFFTWLIERVFKGESDARGRTNYFLQTQTALLLAIVPSGLSIIIAALRARFGIPFIGLIPVVLSAATGALFVFVFMKWMEAFNTAKWVKMVGLAFLALTTLGAVAGIPNALSSGNDTVTIATGKSDVDVGAKEGQQPQVTTETAVVNQPDTGINEAKKGEGGDDIKPNADEVKVDAGPPPTPAEDPKDEPKAVAKAEPEKSNLPLPVPAGGGYPAWRSKFDSIEKRITEDPTVLRRSDVLKVYQELQDKVADAEAKVRKEHKRADARTQSHLRDLALYENSGKTVDTLFKSLFGK
jgi:hypothetical protein